MSHQLIYYYLSNDLKSLHNLLLVSKKFYRFLCNNEILWENFCNLHWPDLTKDEIV